MDWNVYGHDWAVDLLSKHIIQQEVRHAYMISGPPGIGKRTLAISFVQAINCEQPLQPAFPCGQCRVCRQIERMQQPDLSIVQSEDEEGKPLIGGNIKVEQVRALQHSLSLTPYEARFRVALLLRFHEATASAQNALLKTLEEAPKSVVIVLMTDTPEGLLPTIVSRCEIIRLRPSAVEGLAGWLGEKHHIPADKAKLLAHLSSGRAGYALYLNQAKKELTQRVTYLDDLINELGSSRRERMAYAQRLTSPSEIGRQKLRQAMNLWLSFWRDVMMWAYGNEKHIVNLDRQNEIEILAKELSPNHAKARVRDLEIGLERLDANVNARLLAEVVLLDMPYYPMAARSRRESSINLGV